MPNEMVLKKRSEADERFIWDLSEIYGDDTGWDSDFETLAGMISTFEADKDAFTASRESFLKFMDKYENAMLLMDKIYIYAHLKLYEDVGNDKYIGFSERAKGLYTEFDTATAFFRPETLKLEEDVIMGYVDGTQYVHAIEAILTQKPHVLPIEQEELLAQASEMANVPSATFNMLNNVDIKFGTIKDENGDDVEMTNGRYGVFVSKTDRRVRRDAFTAIHKGYRKLQNALAANYYGCIKKDIFFAKARKYDSCLHMYLSHNNIPVEVYKNLLAAVHEFLPAMQHYIKLRKDTLGYSELYGYDLLVPIVKDIDTDVTYEQAKDIIIEGLAPLGEEYTSELKKAFDGGWVDVYENEGKRSGAFQWGTYGSHPVVMMNYAGRFDDMLTLAHEMGHAMHAFYTNANQPYTYSSTPIFLAEIASTVNEALLMRHLVAKTDDKNQKAYYINHILDQYRTTLFRQAMFAEFELIAHEKAAAGVPLTAKLLNGIYKELLEKYYGSDFICSEENESEWSRIPHMYSPFYMYQYSTGFSAAMAFSKMLTEDNEASADKYLTFLKSGDSDFPIEILKKAGLDMSTPDVIRDALTIFESSVKELEALLQ